MGGSGIRAEVKRVVGAGEKGLKEGEVRGGCWCVRGWVGGWRGVGNKVVRGVSVNKWPSFTFTPSDEDLS